METAAALSSAAALWPTKVALAFNDRRSSREIHEILCEESHEGPLQPLGGGKGALWVAPGTIENFGHLVAEAAPQRVRKFWRELTQPTLLQGKLSNLVCNNNKIPHIEFQGIPPSPPPISPPFPTAVSCHAFNVKVSCCICANFSGVCDSRPYDIYLAKSRYQVKSLTSIRLCP